MKVGLIGHAGTGKDTLASYLGTRHGYKIISMYQPAREILFKGCGDASEERTKLNTMGQLLSDLFGRDVFIKWCSNHLTKGNIVIKDARYENELQWLLQACDVVIRLSAKPETVFERLLSRRRPGDPRTLRELTEIWAKESAIDNPPTGVITLENSGGIGELYERMDEILKELRNRADPL